MSGDGSPDYGRLRESLRKLLQTAGADQAKWTELIDSHESLEQENERLKAELRKLRAARQSASVSSMSSRLKDALRE